MTAAHVLERASSHEVAAIGYPATESSWRAVTIDDHECLALDIGICKANVPHGPPIPWGSGDSLLLSEEVQAIGYPYGLDLRLRIITVRAFQGHIVCERKFEHLPELPRVYELSFQCPRGLSGAPIWTVEGEGRVAGVIIGNAITEMEVYSEKETSRESNKEVVLIKTEALHLGIAITPKEILPLPSKLLGGAVGDWLEANQLLRQWK